MAPLASMPASSFGVAVLAPIQVGVARLQIAHDPDGMLLDEVALAMLGQRGFAVLRWRDEVAFRFEYETRFRSVWDRGGQASESAVLIHYAGDTPEELPWDVLHAATLHRLSLADWFSGLDLAVVRAVPNHLLERLYDQYLADAPGALGAGASADFVLHHVYKIVDTLIDKEADFLRLLLDLHLRQVALPVVLVDRLAASLSARAALVSWPVRELLADRLLFMTFIEERWPIAVSAMLKGDIATHETMVTLYHPRVSGPASLPFADHSVRMLVDNLFVEGLLPRLVIAGDVSRLPVWMRAGVVTDQADDDGRQLLRLLDILQTRLAQETLRHTEWEQIGWTWAEAQAIWHRLPLDRQQDHAVVLGEARDAMDRVFAAWLPARFGALASLPSISGPVMGHHVPAFLARRLVDSNSKVALVVMDGMAMDQWVLLQHLLERDAKRFDFQRKALFAWLPTLTSIARQALFAGALPRDLPSLASTQGEPAAWARFWAAHGVASHSVAYRKAIRRNDQLAQVDEVLADHRVRVVGLVVDAVDEMMHGMTLGSRGLHNQVATWQEHGLLCGLFDRLLAAGFEIFVTADHGNIEARGSGTVTQGVLAETRGERVRIYGDQTLYQSTLDKLGASTVAGANTGLPAGRYPLYAAGRGAFVAEGEVIVAHGGACIEEVIVPFVQVGRRVVSA